MKVSRVVRSGALVGVGPAGLPPAGLRTFETVDVDPSGVLVRPAGSIVVDRAGINAWFNWNGAAAGWVNFASLGIVNWSALMAVIAEWLAGGLTDEDYWLRRGRGLAGIAGRVQQVFDSYAIIGGAAYPFGNLALGATGSITQSATNQRAWVFDTGGAANSYAVVFASGQNGLCLTLPVHTSKWYMAQRFAITTAIGAGAELGSQLSVGGTDITMGVVGPVSATNFAVRAGANSLVSGVAVDAAFHVHELWNDGTGTLLYAIDGAAAGSVVMPPTVGPTVYSAPRVYSTAAVVRTLVSRWHCFLSEVQG